MASLNTNLTRDQTLSYNVSLPQGSWAAEEIHAMYANDPGAYNGEIHRILFGMSTHFTGLKVLVFGSPIKGIG